MAKKSSKASKKTKAAAEAPAEEAPAAVPEPVAAPNAALSALVSAASAPDIPAEGESPAKKTKKTKAPAEAPTVKEVITVGDDVDEVDEDATSGAEKELQTMRKWWLEEPWRSLLDPDLVKNEKFLNSDLSVVINEFTQKMLQEELIDFRISGMAIYSGAKMHHAKITDVIKDEQKIQEEEMKEKVRRQFPASIAQPLREARKVATADELFSAMRRAIIETMQKREVLRVRREKSEAKKTIKVEVKGRGKLPAEILKHITGSEETIEQLLQRWQNRIKEIVRLEGGTEETTSMERLKDFIKSEVPEPLAQRLKYIQCFQAVIFLASLNKVFLSQKSMNSDISIKLKDKTVVDLR